MTKELTKLLTECSIRKGGVNVIPTTPRPKTPPPGQEGKMSEYLEFKELEPKPKTKVIEIRNKLHTGRIPVPNKQGKYYGFRLGIIKWYGPWRQYAFYPESETLFTAGCLKEIQVYIKKIMEERRKD